MDIESKKILEETLALAKENNKMLHKMKRIMMWSRIMSIIYWVIIIGSAVGAYYFIQPYVEQAVDVYSGTKDNVNNFNQFFQNLTN